MAKYFKLSLLSFVAAAALVASPAFAGEITIVEIGFEPIATAQPVVVAQAEPSMVSQAVAAAEPSVAQQASALSMGVGMSNHGPVLNFAKQLNNGWGVSGSIGLQDQGFDEGFSHVLLPTDGGTEHYTGTGSTKLKGLATLDRYVAKGDVNVRLRGGLASVSGAYDGIESTTILGLYLENKVHASYDGVVPVIGVGLDGNLSKRPDGSGVKWSFDLLALGKANVSNSNSPNAGALIGYNNHDNLTNPAKLAGGILDGKQAGYFVGVGLVWSF